MTTILPFIYTPAMRSPVVKRVTKKSVKSEPQPWPKKKYNSFMTYTYEYRYTMSESKPKTRSFILLDTPPRKPIFKRIPKVKFILYSELPIF